MRVAVFTGSASGPAAHVEAVREFTTELVEAGVGVVYGGGRVGLMGTVADAVLAAGGDVVGVMPRHLVDREIAHLGLTRLDVVPDMHERKATMMALADAFIALPGGAGTMDELFEAWTWGQLGLHRKPVAVLDVAGFYRPLLTQLDAMAGAGYLSATMRGSLAVVRSAAEYLDHVRDYQTPAPKWSQPAMTVVGWVHVVDGRLLTVRSLGRDRYYLPGGKIEPGEDLTDGLLREVREELSVDLADVRPAFTVRALAHGTNSPTDLTMHCYTASYSGRLRPGREIADIAWLTAADTDRAAPAVLEVLAKLGD